MGDVATPGAAFTPVPVLDLELTADPSGSATGAVPPTADAAAAAPTADGRALVVGRVHGVPVGVAHLGPGTGPVAGRALVQLADDVRAHLVQDGLAPGTLTDLADLADLAEALRGAAGADCRVRPVVPARQPVTVVVCTMGEEPRLLRTVASVLGQEHVDDLELVVVDNRPASGRVAALLRDVHDPRLRIVPEPKPGLSAARNAGVRAARGDLVAFTDDDAYADPAWVARLVEPFAHADAVVCTTGLVLPAEIETPAQLLFEEFGAFDKGFDRLVWSARPTTGLAGLGRPGEGGPLFPYSAGVFGSGNNMAFRRTWLAEQPFDEALGAGTPTRGGEDLDAYLRVILADAVLVYEPAALVWHAARREMSALQGQLYGYGSGMAALVVKHVLHPRRAVAVARRLPAGVRKLLDPASEKNESRSADFPPELGRTELRGYLAGPLLYARSRWRDRAYDRRARPGRRAGTGDAPGRAGR